MESDTRSGPSLSLMQAKVLAQIEVQAAVEVGELTLTGEQLIDLLPGQSFPLSLNSEEEVTLRIGGERVATGRLCECQGELVIEIISVSEDSRAMPSDNL